MKNKNSTILLIILMLLPFSYLVAQSTPQCDEEASYYNIKFNITNANDDAQIATHLTKAISSLKTIASNDEQIEIQLNYDKNKLNASVEKGAKSEYTDTIYYSNNGAADSLILHQNAIFTSNLENQLYQLYLLQKELKKQSFIVFLKINAVADIRQGITISILPKKEIAADALSNSFITTDAPTDSLEEDILKAKGNKENPQVEGIVKKQLGAVHYQTNKIVKGNWNEDKTVKTHLKALINLLHLEESINPKVVATHQDQGNKKKYVLEYTFSNYETKYYGVESMESFVKEHILLYTDSLRKIISPNELEISLKTKTYESAEILSYPSEEKYKNEFGEIKDFLCHFKSGDKEIEERIINIKEGDISILEQEFLKLYFIKHELGIADSATEIIIASDPTLEEVTSTITIIAKY